MIVAPAHTDDGWVWTQYRTIADLGAVSFYFNFWGAISPFSFWLPWLSHWPIGSTTDLVFMRLPIVAVLLSSWAVCRTCLRLAVGGKLDGRSHWALAAVFLVGVVAWGMTLRPESVVGLLALVGLWTMLSFAHAPRMSSLAIGTIAVVLAVTVHPVGIVAIAPLLAGTPLAVRALRTSKVLAGSLAALGLSGSALAIVLITFDADLGQRLVGAKIASYGDTHAYSFWEEYLRYTDFDGGAGLPIFRLISL